MNIETGRVIPEKDIPAGKEDDYMPVNTKEMTPKQKKQGFVHPKDNRSVLGKRRATYAQMTANQRKRLRKKLRESYAG